MSKKALLSFFDNVRSLDKKTKESLKVYFIDFDNSTRFKIEIKESKIYITSLAGEILAFVNVSSR